MAQREILDIVRTYGAKLKEKGIKVYKLILFGSYAEDRATRNSDIDVAVVSGDFGNDRFEERAKLIKIAFYVDARIEPHPVGLQEFDEDYWQTIISEIKSKGIEIAA